MPDSPEHLREPFRKLRESLKHIEKNPPPEEVHKLRIQARRIESIASALEPDGGKKARRLIRPVKQLRRAAGGVRDMDVLMSNALSLHNAANSPSLARLVDYLKSTRAQNALKLLKTVDRESKLARKSLRQYSRLIKSVPQASNGVLRSSSAIHEPADPLYAAVGELIAELTAWPALTVRNIHRFRLKVKELRYVLQALPESDKAFVEALGVVKDQIGEWHDWQQLAEVAGEALPEPEDQALLEEIRRMARKRLRQAKAVSNAMRERWLGTPNTHSSAPRKKRPRAKQVGRLTASQQAGSPATETLRASPSA
jgi:CHAD domain-containing protein